MLYCLPSGFCDVPLPHWSFWTSPPPQPPGQSPPTRLGPRWAQCTALGAGLAGKRQWCVVWKGLMLPGHPGAPQGSHRGHLPLTWGGGGQGVCQGGPGSRSPGPPPSRLWGAARPPPACPRPLPPLPPLPHPVPLPPLSWDPSIPLLPSSVLGILLGKAAPSPPPSHLVYPGHPPKRWQA